MDLEQQAKIFKAIGDVIRLRILELLPDEPRCEDMYNVCELVEAIGGSQPNISRHLLVLKEAGLVQCRKACASVYYWRDPEAFSQIAEVVGRFGAKPKKKRPAKVCDPK